MPRRASPVMVAAWSTSLDRYCREEQPVSLTDVTWVREKPVEAAEEIDRLRGILEMAKGALACAEVIIDADDQPDVWARVQAAHKAASLVLKQ